MDVSIIRSEGVASVRREEGVPIGSPDPALPSTPRFPGGQGQQPSDSVSGAWMFPLYGLKGWQACGARKEYRSDHLIQRFHPLRGFLGVKVNNPLIQFLVHGCFHYTV